MHIQERINSQILTLIKPLGKEISLKAGEIIEAQIVDLFPNGGLTLKIKNSYIPVRTDLVFDLQETVSLKVLGQGGTGNELVFQLLNIKLPLLEKAARVNPPPLVENELMGNLTQKISEQVFKLLCLEQAEGPDRIASTTLSLDIKKLKILLEDLFKALPVDIQSLSKGLRAEIQHVLQNSLKVLGGEVQQRIAQLMKQLPEGLNDSVLMQPLKNNLLSMDGLKATELKEALENSGIVLEAKLKNLSEGLLQEGPGRLAVNPKIQNDLKAVLFQLKELLQENPSQDSPPAFVQRWLERAGQIRGEETLSVSKEGEGIETILKDVQTFQLLSKVTDSFYTYLPVQWTELKRGELVFKRRRQQTGETSYSCGIHLDLKRFGPVSVFIYMQQRDFFVTFKVDHPALNFQIHSHLEDLKENFRREGLSLKMLSSLNEASDLVNPSDRIESEQTLVSIRI